MTSAQIRQPSLDFFKSKQHTIVPSSGLLADSPDLRFTNAGKNQFVSSSSARQSASICPRRAAGARDGGVPSP